MGVHKKVDTKNVLKEIGLRAHNLLTIVHIP